MNSWISHNGIKQFKYGLGLLLLFFCSCTPGIVRDEQERQRNNLSKAILNSFTNRYTIIIYPFRNLTHEEDLDYLTNALPDMIESHLKPIEYETSFIPFESVDFSLNSNVVNLAEATNSIFSNYLLLQPALITQYNAVTSIGKIETIIKTNSPVSNILPISNQISGAIITNTITNLITNMIVTNTIHTNLPKLIRENYMSLVITEFTELTNSICFMPIDVIKSGDLISNAISSNITKSITNILTNVITNIITNNYCEVRGNYSLLEKREGPNQLKVEMKVTFFMKETNSIDMEISGREDKLSDRVFDFVKPVRSFCLNRDTGDVIIDSKPEEASIYYDGIFIGKTPLYYPSIPGGKHIFSLLKQGFAQVVVKADIITNRTNLIFKPIEQIQTGGIVSIKSEPTNALVYIDSSYEGNTPLVLTNLTIETLHRLTIETADSNYYPFYNTFTLHNSNYQYEIDAFLNKTQGTPLWERRLIWYGVYAGWGATLFCVSLNIYADYEQQYYLDQYYNAGNTNAINYYNFYNQLYHASMTWGIIAGIATMGLTCYALYNEEVYLGLNSGGPSDINACLCFRF